MFNSGKLAQPILLVPLHRATPMATPLVVINDGVKMRVALGCSKDSLSSLF